MEMSSHEEWREIKETNGRYSVSSEGRVKNNITGDIKKATPIAKGYLKVNLHRDGIRVNRLVHRLVATEFIPNPENKLEVNHKNGIKIDNRVENLEWVTGEENRRHAYETGLQKHRDERYSGYLYQVWKTKHQDKMCDEWQDFLIFYDWCLNNGYEHNKYIALKDYTKEYSPNNCYISNKIVHPSKKHKDNGIRVRMSNEMYGLLCIKANKKGISASEYIRQLIDKDVKSSPRFKNT